MTPGNSLIAKLTAPETLKNYETTSNTKSVDNPFEFLQETKNQMLNRAATSNPSTMLTIFAPKILVKGTKAQTWPLLGNLPLHSRRDLTGVLVNKG